MKAWGKPVEYALIADIGYPQLREHAGDPPGRQGATRRLPGEAGADPAAGPGRLPHGARPGRLIVELAEAFDFNYSRGQRRVRRPCAALAGSS
jgi:hypothetical protein